MSSISPLLLFSHISCGIFISKHTKMRSPSVSKSLNPFNSGTLNKLYFFEHRFAHWHMAKVLIASNRFNSKLRSKSPSPRQILADTLWWPHTHRLYNLSRTLTNSHLIQSRNQPLGAVAAIALFPWNLANALRRHRVAVLCKCTASFPRSVRCCGLQRAIF